jgi:hypothetical protein
MKVRVEFQLGERTIRDEVEGKDATEILSLAKSRVMKQLGWKGVFLAPLTPLTFAQEAVRRYNDHFKTNYPAPQSADQFIHFGEQTGSLTVLER